MRAALAAVAIAAAVIASAAGAARPAAPSSNDGYAWHGLVCATPSVAIAAVDTIAVETGGHRRLCHSTRVFPWHRGIVATTFWVGEVFDPSVPDGSQVCSTYDADWAYHWSGVDRGKVPRNADACAGAIVGGCDGVVTAAGCATQPRTAANGYFPTQATPRENPFYLDLPFDDVNDPVAFRERCRVIPWAYAPGYAGHCGDGSFSYMKNQWVRLVGPNGKTCYGQVEDAGPSHGSLYHDAAYVFGTTNARPVQGRFGDAGLDVSPALNGCLGFAALDGDTDRVDWQFVVAHDVPNGPWKRLVTVRGVDEG